MKRLFEWYRDYNKRWCDAHPEFLKVRRIVLRCNGLIMGIAGLIMVEIALYEFPRPISGWELAMAILGCLAFSAAGFAMFAWSFKMRD